jgi:hypothetical protein
MRGSWDIPSIWRSPITRQPGSSPRRKPLRASFGSAPGWRVIALGEIDGPHPAHLNPTAAVLVTLPRSLRRRCDGMTIVVSWLRQRCPTRC